MKLYIKLSSAIFLILTAKAENFCKPLWDNTCVGNGDCCSNFCSKEPHWAVGVCKPATGNSSFGGGETGSGGGSSGGGGGACKPLWDNSCTGNSECCSNFCSKEPHWALGVCKPGSGGSSDNSSFGGGGGGGSTSSGGGTCKPLWDNSCTANSDCCTNFCSKEPHWRFGVCRPGSGGSGGSSGSLPSSGGGGGSENSGGSGGSTGGSDGINSDGPCKPLWDNSCTANGDCCSNFCSKQPHWSLGVCKPGSGGSGGSPGISSFGGSGGSSGISGCKPLWNNTCTSNDECCTKFCSKEPHWKLGVCKPGSGVSGTDSNSGSGSSSGSPGPGESANNNLVCKPLWDNTCTGNSECCSGNCFKEPHWALGVCKESSKS